MTTGPLSQCGTCQRLRSPFSPEANGQTGPWCEAFPQEIPTAIYDNTLDHRQPILGDHGLQWVARPGTTYPTIYLPAAEPEPALVAHLPGKHDQREHGRGRKTKPSAGAGMSASEFDDRAGAAASGDTALQAAPVGADTPLNRGAPLRGLSGKTPAERRAIEKAVNDYRADGYASVARGLHKRGRLSQQDRATVRGLDEAMAASHLKTDVITHRGYRDPSRLFPPGQWRDGDMTGMRWRDPSFASTSTDAGVARTFATTISRPGVPAARPTEMRILVPRGTPAIQLSWSASRPQGESELLLGRGLTYRIVRDRGLSPDGVRQLDVVVE